MTESLTIESAGVAAFDVLAALQRATFSEPWGRTAWARFLALPGTFALLAHVPNGAAREPVGFALFKLAAEAGEVLSFGVSPAHRRLGAGRALLQAGLERIAGLGATRIFLDVALDNEAARRLYVSCGFVEVGRRPLYYAAEGRRAATALTLWRDVA